MHAVRPGVSWDDIGGLSEAKKLLSEAVSSLVMRIIAAAALTGVTKA